MNKQMRDIIKDAFIMTVVASGLAVLCNYTFAAIKGAGAKSDPLVTAVTQSNKDGIDAALSETSFAADNLGTASLGEFRVARVNKADPFGRTALMWAAYVNFAEAKAIADADEKRVTTATTLLDAGADANLRDSDQWNALMWASWSGLTKTADLLIARGTEVNAVDRLGQTALMFAAMRGNTAIVKLLLDKGADKNLAAANGKRAADYVTDAAAQYPDRAAAYEAIRPLL